MPRGEGYLRKRGNVWYFEFIRGEYLPPREENLTFRELADTYKDWYLRTSQATEHAKKEHVRKRYRRAFKNACKKAGLQDFRFHDLRHTFASWVAMKTKDIYLVQRLLNHQKIDTTKRYAHLTQEYMVNALEEISAVFRLQKGLDNVWSESYNRKCSKSSIQ